MANIIAPDGTPGQAPDSEVDRLLLKGYKLPEQAAPSAPAFAIEPAAPPDAINLRAPDGTIGSAPLQEVERLTSMGYAPVGYEEIDRDARKQFNESALGHAATFGEQVAEGATLGLYGLGMTLADESYGKRIDERETDNPLTALGGELTGAVGSAFVGGLALAPAALVERAGVRAGEMDAARLGGGTAARIAGAATSGAIEGGLSNAAFSLAEEFPEIAQDPVGVAEHVIASAGEGLLLGGAVGGGLGVLGEGLANLARHTETRATRVADQIKKAREAAPVVDEQNMGEIVLKLEAKPEFSADILAQADARPGALRQLDEVKAAEGGFEDAVQVGIRDIEAQQNLLHDMLDDIDTDAGISEKIKQMAKMHVGPIKTLDVTEPIRKIEERLNAVELEFGETALADGGGLLAIKKVRSQINHALSKINEVVDGNGDILSDHAGDVFNELDQLKRITQRLADGNKNRIIRKVLRDETEVYRQHLQNEQIWGELATTQTVVNAPQSDRFLKQGHDEVQKYTFNESNKRARDLYESKTRANPKAIGGLLKNIGDATLRAEESAYRQWLRAAAKDAVTRAAVWGTPELREKAVKAIQAVASIEKQLDNVARTRADMIAGQRAAKLSPMMEVAANAASSVVPMSGMLITGVAQLKRNLLRATASTMGDTQVKVLNAATRLVGGAAKGVQAVRKVAPAATVITERNLDQEVQAALAVNDPNSVASMKILQDAAHMEDLVPGMGAAYLTNARARAQFIASKLPVSTAPTAMFAANPRFDPQSERKMRRYIAASYAPTAALERVAAGKGTVEDVETVRTLYPTLYKNFVAATAQQLGKLKRPPTKEERIRISLATGLEVDPTVKRVAKLQQVAVGGASSDEQAAEQNGKPGAPIKMGGNPDKVYAPRGDRIMTRGG